MYAAKVAQIGVCFHAGDGDFALVRLLGLCRDGGGVDLAGAVKVVNRQIVQDVGGAGIQMVDGELVALHLHLKLCALGFELVGGRLLLPFPEVAGLGGNRLHQIVQRACCIGDIGDFHRAVVVPLNERLFQLRSQQRGGEGLVDHAAVRQLDAQEILVVRIVGGGDGVVPVVLGVDIDDGHVLARAVAQNGDVILGQRLLGRQVEREEHLGRLGLDRGDAVALGIRHRRFVLRLLLRQLFFLLFILIAVVIVLIVIAVITVVLITTIVIHLVTTGRERACCADGDFCLGNTAERVCRNGGHRADGSGFFRSHLGVCVGHLQLADLALQLHLAGGVDLEAFDLCTLFQRNGCGCRQAFIELQGLQLTADGQRGLGAEGEVSAFSGAVLDRDTDAALFAFSKIDGRILQRNRTDDLVILYKLHHIVDDLQAVLLGGGCGFGRICQRKQAQL